MTKLSKKDIKKIRKLYKSGELTIKELSELFKVSMHAIDYWICPKLREHYKKYSIALYKKKQSWRHKHPRKWRKSYREYERKKYHTDPEYRKKMIEANIKQNKKARKEGRSWEDKHPLLARKYWHEWKREHPEKVKEYEKRHYLRSKERRQKDDSFRRKWNRYRKRYFYKKKIRDLRKQLKEIKTTDSIVKKYIKKTINMTFLIEEQLNDVKFRKFKKVKKFFKTLKKFIRTTRKNHEDFLKVSKSQVFRHM